LVEGKTCEIAKVDGNTVAYLGFGPRRLLVEIPVGHGNTERIPVASARDIQKAVKAMKQVAARRAKSAKPKVAAGADRFGAGHEPAPCRPERTR
jgi:hypothetical protein